MNSATIHQLATSDWVRAGHPLCLIGDSGTGKSHCETRGWSLKP